MGPVTVFLLQLEAYYKRVGADSRIGPVHISLYLTIIQLWWQGHFTVSQCQLMKMAKIRIKATYHKYLKDLVCLGYIHYKASYHPFYKSEVAFH